MAYIRLMHSHYDPEHLDEVKTEMLKLGAPSIRAIWSEAHGMWYAVEGCHRIRAAKELGIEVNIIDVSKKRTITIELDAQNEKVKVADLLDELQSETRNITVIDI